MINVLSVLMLGLRTQGSIFNEDCFMLSASCLGTNVIEHFIIGKNRLITNIVCNDSAFFL